MHNCLATVLEMTSELGDVIACPNDTQSSTVTSCKHEVSISLIEESTVNSHLLRGQHPIDRTGIPS